MSARSPAADVDVVWRLDLTPLQELDVSVPAAARRVWDTLHLAATLQGLANRTRPRLVLRWLAESDDFWWNDALHGSGWLRDAEVHETDDLVEVLRMLRDAWQGVVVYPEQPWAASNVASTLAGIDDRLAIRADDGPDSLYAQLRAAGCWGDGEEYRLVDAGGRAVWDAVAAPTAKLRAIRWMIERFACTGRADPHVLAFYIDAYWLTRPDADAVDNCTLTNHDYFVAHRACFFDLSAWEDEPATDDPDQPLGGDLEVLRQLLAATRQRATKMTHVGGFTPWQWKYSDVARPPSRHDGVQSEWKLVKELSAYDAYLDADALSYAGLANASFYQHFPLQERYPQHVRRRLQDGQTTSGVPAEGKSPRIFVMLYMGDYDAAAWFTRLTPRFWRDPARGRIDCNWAFNPNLACRAPHVMHHIRAHASDRDWFITGNCGAGYLNPAELTAPRRDPAVPDGWDRWIRHNQAWYERFDLDITGFIIEGLSAPIGEAGLQAYASFSPGGVVCHRHAERNRVHRSGMPYTRMTADLGGSPEQAARALLRHVSAAANVRFHCFRTVIQSPSWHLELIHRVMQAHPGVSFVPAPEFFGRLSAHHAQRLAPIITADHIDRWRNRPSIPR